MGKKTDITKAAAALAPAAKAPAKKPAVKKAAVKKPAAVKKATVAKAAYTQDDIALRAYFIAEKRHKEGRHGDSHSDWVEAERQLHAESKKKKAPAKNA